MKESICNICKKSCKDRYIVSSCSAFEHKPIKGLSQAIYEDLVAHCKKKVDKYKDNMAWFAVYNEHRIFLELLERVGCAFIEKEE